MQKSLYSLLCLLFLAASARAGSNDANTNYLSTNGESFCGPVIVQAPDYAIGTYFRALFLKPTTSNLDYAVISCVPSATSTSSNYTVQEINPKYHFGFDVGLYAMLSNCSNICLNYERFKSSRTETVVRSNDDLCSLYPLAQTCGCVSTAAAAGTAQGLGTVAFKFDAAHVLLGQFVQVGPRLQTNLFVGVNYSSIQEKVTTSISHQTAAGLENRTITTPMRFSGAGPEFGVDFNHNAFGQLNVAGRLSTAFLVGRSSNSTSIASESPLNADTCTTNPNIQTLGRTGRSQTVPVLYGRIGLGFDMCFCTCRCQYITSFEVGFESRTYFNALQHHQITAIASQASLAPLASEVTIGSLERNTSNFGLSGAYISASIAI